MPDPHRTLTPAEAATLLDGVRLNLIRRGADGSLVMSTDHWLLTGVDDEAFTFTAEPPAPPETPPTVIRLADIGTITWDRLTRQQERSQVRFRMRSGDLQTFSGRLADPD
jgi:hypothetical protein